MAYQLRSAKGIPIRKDGSPVMATETIIECKLEQLDEAAKSFVAVASDESEDRDKDIIRVEGWDLRNFKKNPIMPWSHNWWGVPIGKSLRTWVDKQSKRLMFKPQFDANDPESMKIFNKYKGGFLTSFSVGFRGIEFNWRDEDQRWYGGREFTKQELLEISPVAVPANPNASTNFRGFIGNDGEFVKTLLQMGYPEMFAKTKSGLFYPISDLGQFTEPKEFNVSDGITMVKAYSIDENGKSDEEQIVAYSFDSSKFDDKSAHEWVKLNGQKEQKVKFFDFKNCDGNNFQLELVEETIPFKNFDVAVDLIDSDEVIEFEDNKSQDLNEDDDIHPNEDLTNTDDKNKTDSSIVDDPQTPESVVEDPKNDSTSQVKTEETIVVESKRIIKISILVYDSENKIIDSEMRVIATNQEINSVKEFKTLIEGNELQGIKEMIQEVSDFVKELKTSDAIEKFLAKQKQIPDNTDTKETPSEVKVDSNDEDLIELDESLTPGNEEASGNEDLIEVDDAFINEGKSPQLIINVISDAMKNQLRSALRESFGRID